MQNITNKSYINSKKIINIKSELLCREAEDDFFYFNNVNIAYKKLCEAVKLSPNHLKSIILLADVSFVKGYIKKALELYIKAENLGNNSAKIYASIANCYNILKCYDKALEFCNKALDIIGNEAFSIYSQIIEIKINILIMKKMYKQAYVTFIQAQNIIDKNSLKSIYNINYEILNKKLNIQKRLNKTHLKIV